MSSWPLLVGLGAGVLGVLFGLRCYVELRRWARLIQRGGIVIGYKNKAQLEAPLVELAEWITALGRDEAAGRVIYSNRGVRVAILRNRQRPAITTKRARRLPWRRRSSSSSETVAA